MRIRKHHLIKEDDPSQALCGRLIKKLKLIMTTKDFLERSKTLKKELFCVRCLAVKTKKYKDLRNRVHLARPFHSWDKKLNKYIFKTHCGRNTDKIKWVIDTEEGNYPTLIFCKKCLEAKYKNTKETKYSLMIKDQLIR